MGDLLKSENSGDRFFKQPPGQSAILFDYVFWMWFTPKTGVRWASLLIHWGRDKMAAIFRMTFWNAFDWMNECMN